MSNVQVEAAVAPNPEKLMIASEEEAAILEDTFDIGLANVEVHATLLDEIKLDDGTTFRRMAIEERITEINGEQVVQTNAGQQILDVFDNGKVERWAVDPLTGFLLPGPAMVAEEENADQTQEKQQHDDMSSGRFFNLSPVFFFLFSFFLSMINLTLMHSNHLQNPTTLHNHPPT